VFVENIKYSKINKVILHYNKMTVFIFFFYARFMMKVKET